MILDERAERMSAIKCYSKNDNIEPAVIQKWLRKLAIERIELKVRRFEARLIELVDEQKRFVGEAPPRYEEILFGVNPEELPMPI